MGMAAILINGPWLFVQIFNPPSTEGSTWRLKKIGPRVSDEKSFKVYRTMHGRRRTDDDDGRRMASDHISSSWAFGSDELNILILISLFPRAM